jgi:hypothetical protein
MTCAEGVGFPEGPSRHFVPSGLAAQPSLRSVWFYNKEIGSTLHAKEIGSWLIQS